MMKNKNLIKSIVLYAVMFVVAAVLTVGTAVTNIYADLVTNFFNQSSTKYVDENGKTVDIEYYKSDYKTLSELQKYEAQLAETIQAEGAVLLRNENNALPLKEGAKITLLGVGSSESNFLYGGAGSGAIDTKNSPNLKEAFESAGYSVNPTMWKFYNSGNGKSSSEVDQSKYSATETSSFSSYNDAAIIVITRGGLEGGDLSYATTDSNGNAKKHDLELSDNELALIKTAKKNFSKVVILLNTMNAMELGPIAEGDYAIDACLWVGAGGQMGLNAIPKILNGTLSPSGKLVDTYAYDALSAPAMQNYGSYSLQGVTEKGNAYVSYAEGIYVGYRYYETRYYDCVANAGSNASSATGAFASENGWSYNKEVQYTFGYGLSYSDFSYSDFKMTEKDDCFEISVKVTNTSDVVKKDKAVVEIYMQSPYTETNKAHGVEKSAVELVGFGKTKSIGKNESDTVTVKVNKELMRAWDSEANGGKGGYTVDAGDYYFAFGVSAHDALNNILAKQGKTTSNGMDYNGDSSFVAKYTSSDADSVTYNTGADGKQIENQFANADLANYIDYKYLSRSDWSATWPKAGEALTVDESSELYKILYNDVNDVYQSDENATMPKTGVVSSEYGKLSLVSVMDCDYNDAKWDALVSQMSIDELTTVFRVGGYATKAVESVNKPSTVDKDGPAGISATLVGGAGAFGYPVEVLIASTWNEDLAEKVGDCVGEDGYWTGVSGWYAPSMNTHRTPFSGRNFEYYSEDGFIGGIMGAATVRGAQNKGVYCYIKHFALNDQEKGRSGICTFSNEQAIRDIYLRPFEYSVRNGDSLAVMVSMNRVGPVWSGAHKGLMTNTLRGEWGFKGFSITDQASTGGYYPVNTGLINGLDMMLNTNNMLWKLDEGYENNATIISALQRANKNVLYAVAHSNAMNGLAEGVKVVEIMPLWQKLLITADVVLGVAIVVGVVLTTKYLLSGKKQSKKAE